MRVAARTVEGATVVTVYGDITITGTRTTPLADTVRDLLARHRTHVILDLAHVHYVDSAGLGELVHALAAAHNRGGTLALLHVSRRLHEQLDLTRLRSAFDCFDDEATAVASVAPPGPRAV
jgi:anti-sigma B factor antagonist